MARAAARVREARALESLARAQLFPTLDAGLSASHSRSVSALGSASETGSVQPVFQSAYEVDLFGRIDSQVEAARAAYLASAAARDAATLSVAAATRSEEHTSELQSLMRISYAVFCLKKKITITNTTSHNR